MRTPFDIPVVIFLLTAGVGVWASYQSVESSTKFWLLLIAVLFYYLLARQPIRNLWRVAGILSLLGFLIGVFFFLSDNWEIQAQKYQIFKQIVLTWMRIRPDLNLEPLHPNDVAGIAALTLPFSIALSLESRRRKSTLESLLFGLIACLILFTILSSASRGAWIAVSATTGLWTLWAIIDRLTRQTKHSNRAIFILALGLLACLVVGYTWTTLQGRLNQVAVGNVDMFITDKRFHIFWSTTELIKDVPYTGGGLAGFPGLYSSYILINPNYIIGYSHNIFLDASLEQGILGGLMLCWIYLGCVLWLALRPAPLAHSLLHKAILSSLLIIIFHGLVDNIVYRSTFTTLLFFIPGMAVGLKTSVRMNPEGKRQSRLQTRRLAVSTLIALSIILIGLIAFRRPLLSAWYTNLGAVEMSKVELSDFPTGVWDEGQDVDLLSPAELLFNQALAYEPANPRAHYRLGLIAMLKRDFPAAVIHLEIAYRGDLYHRGMLKALGLSYIWNGQIEAALPLLSKIPESNQEIAVYPWWWRTLNRPDLAANAEQYLEVVDSEQ